MRTSKSNQFEVHYDEKIDCIMKIMAIAPIEVSLKTAKSVKSYGDRMLLINKLHWNLLL